MSLTEITEIIKSIRDGEMTPEETLSASRELLKKAKAQTKSMAEFVLAHPDLFKEGAVEKSKKILNIE